MSSSELPPTPPPNEGSMHVSMPGGPTNLGRDVLPEDVKAYRAFIGPWVTRFEETGGSTAFTEKSHIPFSLDTPPLPGQTAIPEAEMQRRRDDARTYQAVQNSFPDTPAWHRLLRGGYPALMQAANSLARNVAEGFNGEWTLPRAFGVHALVSVFGALHLSQRRG